MRKSQKGGGCVTENIIVWLKTNINFLTKVEQKIAKLIVENPKKFITYSMSDLAQRAGVSQGSIINFSTKFANGGFPELKLQISACCASHEEQQFNIVESDDTLKEALEKNINSLNEAYRLTQKVNNEETLKRVTERILKAKKVEIYGIYRSAAVASDLFYQLLQLGIPVAFISDILTCAVSAAMLDENSLVIAISSSGKTKDIIDAVENARANNVPIVSVTSNINSPLAKLSDDVLIAASSGNSISNSPTEVRSSQLLITDTICSYIRNKIHKNDESIYFKLKKILNSHSVEEVEDE